MRPPTFAKSWRRFCLVRFSVRRLLLAVTLVAIWLGAHLHSARQQRAAVSTIRAYGGWVHYDYQMNDWRFDPHGTSWVPDWLRTPLGDDMFHSVVEVNFCYNDDKGGRADNANLAEAPLACLQALPNVQTLLLHRTQATDSNLKHLTGLKRIRRVYIWDAFELTDAGAAQLAKLRSLRYLHINDSKITDESLRMFAKLPQLEGLCLQFHDFTDDGVRELRKLSRLRSLWVCGRSNRPNNIHDESLEFLFSLPHLEQIGIQHTYVTKQFTERIKLKFPGVYVSRTP